MASNPSLTETQRKQLNLTRYGLMVVPIVAWVVAFAMLFSVRNDFGDALVPSLITLVIVAVICYAVFWAYKRFVLKI